MMVAVARVLPSGTIFSTDETFVYCFVKGYLVSGSHIYIYMHIRIWVSSFKIDQCWSLGLEITVY